MTEPDEEEPEFIETGPFCRHWDDPADCSLVCRCGHRCGRHYCDDDDTSCMECDCAKWEEGA